MHSGQHTADPQTLHICSIVRSYDLQRKRRRYKIKSKIKVSYEIKYRYILPLCPRPKNTDDPAELEAQAARLQALNTISHLKGPRMAWGNGCFRPGAGNAPFETGLAVSLCPRVRRSLQLGTSCQRTLVLGW